MNTFTSRLSQFQLGVLLETVQALGDKKVVHIPSTQGEKCAVPFTTEILQQMIDFCGTHYDDDQPVSFDFEISAKEDGTSTVDIRHDEKNARFTYTVQGDEFREH